MHMSAQIEFVSINICLYLSHPFLQSFLPAQLKSSSVAREFSDRHCACIRALCYTNRHAYQ